MNIFEVLKRGNVRNEEYFSSSLSVVLNENPELTSFLINKIFGTDVHLEEEDYEVVLEESFEEGRIDIVIKSLSSNIYIENKISADLGENQLERYSNYIRQRQNNAKLILLSRDYIEDPIIKECTDEYLFWSELYQMIEEFLVRYSDKIKKNKNGKVYLITRFLEFLRGKNMSDEKVSWEYYGGLKSFLNLLNMIQSVLKRLQKEDLIKEVSKKNIGIDYAGCYIRKSEGYNSWDFWVGINYSSPEKLYFEFLEKFIVKCKDTESFEKMPKSPDDDPSKILDFDEIYFLAFSKEQQKKAIYDFVKESLEYSSKICAGT